jgi:two-component system sensor histidine kinase VanS
VKGNGIFVKVFIYTTLFSALLVGIATVILLQQLMSYRAHIRMQSIVDSFGEAVEQAEGSEDIGQVGRIFDFNLSFPFVIADKDGEIVYQSRNAARNGIAVSSPPGNSGTMIIRLNRDYNLYAQESDVFTGDYGRWILQALLISGGMFFACVIGAYFFAKGLSQPIRVLADNTHKMANLEDAPPMPERHDELGELSRDVYAMYRELKDKILKEQEIAEAQRYFFATASHELKTPVAATSALLEGMLAGVGDYKDHPKYLRECLKLTETQSGLVSEMLEVVNLTDGKITPAPEPFNLKSLIDGILPEFQALAESGGLRISAGVPGEMAIFADPKMLKRALSNVLLNAVQNTPSGGKVRLYLDGARLCVLNTGAKIPDDELPKLFAPFYRVDKARSRKDGRSGLGLTIVQKTLETMKIGFSLDNTPDGVLFCMDLPQTQIQTNYR